MNPKPSATGFGLGYILGYFFALTIGIAVAWNVGLYGAQLVDNKIGFWTAVGLTMCVGVVRGVFRRPPTIITIRNEENE